VSTKVALRMQDGSTSDMPLSAATAKVVLSAAPWRTIRSRRGQRHFPGLYWSSTSGGHVVYESRLELARLMLADADREVVGIAAQPFLVSDNERRHVPDFLLVRADGSALVVNVKPADRLKDPRVAAALAWADAIFTSRGWQHEIWSAADPVVMLNTRFLAGYRRVAHLDNAEVAAAAAVDVAGLTIAQAEAAFVDAGISEPRPVLLHLLWSGVLHADLTQPLSRDTALEVYR
jgi:hypothetical protein